MSLSKSKFKISDDDLSLWTKNSIKNLNKLCEYAKPLNVNILVENHGEFSSNADYLVNVIGKS